MAGKCPRCGCPNSKIRKCSDCSDDANVCMNCGFEYHSKVMTVGFLNDPELVGEFGEVESDERKGKVDELMAHLLSDDHNVGCHERGLCNVVDDYSELFDD